MTIPTYDKFIEPVLRFLEKHPNGVLAKDAHNAAADVLKLTDSERAELLPSGNQAIYKNRAGWAHDRLKRAGYSYSPKRGYWQLTKDGLAFAKTNPAPLPDEVIEHIATSFMDVVLRPGEENNDAVETHFVSATESPDDRLESALAELKASVSAELLQILLSVSPAYFETIVLDLLHRMGYGDVYWKKWTHD